ncbi:HAD-IIIA family hydrolase [Kitasatospora purpeofusca]|uniref:D-glycero-alpha-D-manno-heptose-1,7-bisphosphate 7-phosphatase n=1 Tax=Kitasatospora purpeofusca TaxID=67352 RepID=UPI00324D3B94
MMLTILDRDGVLNVNRPGHVLTTGQWRWLPGALDACRRLSGSSGGRLAVVTNQAAVGRGLLPPSGLAAIHRRMTDDLARAGVARPLVLHCPHRPEARCWCRKPAPGMVHAAMAWFGVDAERTVVVGDHLSDLRAARAAGCWGAHVRSGRGVAPGSGGPRYLGSFRDLSAYADTVEQRRTAHAPRP